MTARAVILGLLGAAAVCGFTYFNDAVMHQTMFVGNNMPISVYGGLILFLFVMLPASKSLPIRPEVVAGMVAGVATAPIAGLAAGLAGGPAVGLGTGVAVGLLVGLTAALVFAFCPRAPAYAGALAAGLVAWLVTWPLAGLATGFVPAILTGLAAGLVTGLVTARVVLTGKELAVALTLTLAACCIPGSGLLRTFTSGLMMPHHYNRTETGWKENRVTEMLPEQMLAGVAPFIEEEDILDPRGLSSRLIEAGRAASGPSDVARHRGTGESACPARRIWALISDEDRGAIRAGLERALSGPDESWRSKAHRALERALRGREKRRKQQQLEELLPADIAALRKAIADALSPPTPASPSTPEAVRALDAVMTGKGFSPEERETVTAVVGEALSEAEDPCRAAAARALNGLLETRDLYNVHDFEGVTLSERAADLLGREEGSLSDEHVRELNRHLVDSSFPEGTIRTLVAREDMALNGFVQGLSVGEKHIGLAEIPWGAWTRTFSFWLPLILILWIGLIALSVVVHRQWSTYEQLPYPIATFAASLLPASEEARSVGSSDRPDDAATGSVFKNRLFWIGVAGVLFVHMNNYAYTWNPELVMVPTSFDCSSLRPLLPNLDRGGGWFAFRPRIYFTVIAFAYFLATDVSLSLGIGPYVYCWIVGILAGYGIAVGGGSYLSPNYQRMQLFGAYLGMLLTLVYTGRHYYANVLKKALYIRSREEVERQSVWAARVFLVMLAVFVVDLSLMGLDWQLALLYALGVVTIFLVMARISAETGLFFIQPYWAPCLIMVGILGPAALGPRAILFMLVLTTVFLIDPRESLMPFVVNSFKLLDLKKVKVGRPAIYCGVALVVGLVVGLTVTLYFQYDRGANMQDGWANKSVPKFAFDEAVSAGERLKAQGVHLESVSGFARLKYVTTEPGMIVAFAVGLVLVLVFVLARWRLPRWPLHPVMFLIWSSYPGKVFAFSFAVGWLLKATVVKYGGEAVYRKLKPLMFGLIAGDMLGGIIPTIMGVFYYLFTNGVLPKSFDVMPG